eukprot:CAMPEP_0114413500 /NCGR_PEP_ID=MMETSP0103-20121206/889_1 /TAXON_ID=37642 ORGANISM="Paraphysomonas imperforata, Strain PA2" /NCGR_SAMPLE_ID=MMETSP0103 /ASSEMBLY_ACC=CAM_ASM_000201 /LENGTH=370 /DNA_ID=CAMNT_0001581581 /DNA_START=195 /DNA_END=1308 /DNA_ORIENTATION=+
MKRDAIIFAASPTKPYNESLLHHRLPARTTETLISNEPPKHEKSENTHSHVLNVPSHSNTSGLPTLHAVTYASHGGRDDRFCRAIESAVRHEVDLVILGWGVKWKGLSQKLEAAQSFANALPKDDIILFTDAFDVMFTNDPKHIMETYQSLTSEGKDIIFAGECGCWPHVTIDHGRPCFEKYPVSPTPYRYLNSGTWIGKAAPSAAMLHAVQVEAGKNFANANDQELVADMFMEGRFGIALDYHARLFQSMHLTLDKPLPRCKPIDDIQVVGQGRLYNKRTDTYPAVFHFNGGGKRHHLDLEGKLWYKKSQFNTNEEIEHLRSHRLRAPIATDMSRTLAFEQICPAYFKQSSSTSAAFKDRTEKLREAGL